jgi:hypothetical protein
MERMVNPSLDTLRDLFPALPHPVFIARDEILSPAFSVGFLGIQEDSHIFVFDEFPRPPAHSTGRRASIAPPFAQPSWCQWFVELVQEVSRGEVTLREPPDRGTTHEAARVQDVLFRKIDGTPSIYRKVVTLFRRYEEDSEP